MKKLTLSIAFLAGCFVTSFAQAPQSFKYQAVARDAAGQIIKNQVVGLRLSILEGGASGTLEYQETHHPVSSDIGVFSVNVGQGTVLSGSMGSIAWGSDEHWLRVEMDASGGSTFQLMGASQLLSVPYALHAGTVANNDDADASPTNELQTISKSGNTVTLSNGGGSFTDAVDDADANPANELQTISKSGNTVTLSNGGGSFTDAVDDADANPANELQTISKTGNTVTLSNGGGSFTDAVDDADANPTNELQTLSFSLATNMLSLSNGNSVDLSSLEDEPGMGGDDNQLLSLAGTTLTIENGNSVDLSVIQDGVNDADADPTNELQTISKTGSTVTLSNGGGSFTDAVDDADANPVNELQTISKTGNTVTLSNGGGSFTDAVDDADANPTNEIQQLSLSGNTLGISGSNSVDLSAFASPWQPVPTGINYDAGIVYTEEQQVDSLVQVGNNTPTRTQLWHNGLSVDYFNLDGSSAWLQGNRLRFDSPNPSTRHALLALDSLEFFKAATGLLFNSRSALDADRLRFEYGTALSQLTAGSLWNTNGLFNSQLHPWALTVEEILSPSDIFTRFRLEPDSLTLWNGAKWKNAWLGTESTKGNGGLHLYSGGNDRPVARLGDSDPNNFFGNAPEGGLTLFDHEGKSRASLISRFGSGSLFVENGSNYVGAGEGVIGAGTIDSLGGGFDIISPRLLAGVSQKTGFLEIYDDSPSGPIINLEAKAGMRVESGEGCVFSDGLFKIKYPGTQLSSTQMTHLGVTLFDSLGAAAASMHRDFAVPHVGYLTTYGENYSLNFQAGANWSGGNPSGGLAAVFDANSEARAGMEVDATNAGQLFARGFNGSNNFRAGYNIITGNLNTGSAIVADENDILRAGMYVDALGFGVVFGDIKNFRMAHPADPSKEIWYASLEGPEAAAYVRGTATLQNGEAFVPFPEHFRYVANPATMTATLTPMSADTYGLAVVEKTAAGIRVKELKGGAGNFSFDWEVKCVRAGYEGYEVVRERIETQVLKPSDGKK